MDWTFKGTEYTRVLPALYSQSTLNHITEFMLVVSKNDKRCVVDAKVLLIGCTIVMCQPESNLWCPACVLFTRFVLLLLYPAHTRHLDLFIASFAGFSDQIAEKTSLKCWELENLGVFSFDEKHLSTPNKIWGASVDYLAMLNALKALAPQTSEPPLGAMERSRSIRQYVCGSKPSQIPGPLTAQGKDLDLMLFLYGDQYYQYQRVNALINEEFEDVAKWRPAFESFLSGVIQSVNSERGGLNGGSHNGSLHNGSSHNDSSNGGSHNDSSHNDNSHNGNSHNDTHNANTHNGLFEYLHTRPSHPDLSELMDLDVSSVLNHVNGSLKAELPATVHKFSKEAVLTILAAVQQHYLEVTVGSRVPVFSQAREAAQMARDLAQGANLCHITLVDAVATMRKTNTKAQTARQICCFLARQLYKLPSPAFQQSLPLPFTYLSLEVFEIACQLRSHVFASLLAQDFERLGIKPCAKFRRKLLAALASLPLYLETTGITTVTEQICMLASQFAPVDFDHLDVIYDKVIYLLVRDDERIDQLLQNLQDLTMHMLNPLSTLPIELMTTYKEFMPTVEQICNISCMALSVYWPIYEAIYDMVK